MEKTGDAKGSQLKPILSAGSMQNNSAVQQAPRHFQIPWFYIVLSVLLHMLNQEQITRGIKMDNAEIDRLVRRAELEIGQILKRLKLETNQLVDDIELCCMAVDENFENGPTYLRHVLLKMRCLPGSNWR
jgi:hypothetical protein